MAWWKRPRPFPYPRDVAGSALAVFYLAGGLTGAVILVLPHPQTLNTAVLTVCSGTALLLGLVAYLLRRWLPPAGYPWLLALGTGLITILVATAGSASAAVSFSFLYIWVVFYALLFFPPVGLTVQIAVAAAAYLAALAVLGHSGVDSITALEPVLLAAVVGTTSVVVTMLSRARESSEIDPLTCVANRRGLDRHLESALWGAPADHGSLVVAMIDIDHFKTINDVHGHATGDRLLQDVTRGWRPLLRQKDLIGRFGGDEFTIILPDCSRPDAAIILERLRMAVPDSITCSVGAALWQPGHSVSMLLSHADAALYEAKRLGRNRLAWAALD